MTRFRADCLALYDGDVHIGYAQSPSLAREIVEALNARPPAPVDTGPRDRTRWLEDLYRAVTEDWLLDPAQRAMFKRHDLATPASIEAPLKALGSAAPAPPTSPGPAPCHCGQEVIRAGVAVVHVAGKGWHRKDGCEPPEPAPSPGLASGEPWPEEGPIRRALRHARNGHEDHWCPIIQSALEMEARIATLEAQLRLSEAGAAQMREALEEIRDRQGCGIEAGGCGAAHTAEVNLAGSPAGSAFLERMRALEAVAQAAIDYLVDLAPFATRTPAAVRLRDAVGKLGDTGLAALDAEPKEGG